MKPENNNRILSGLGLIKVTKRCDRKRLDKVWGYEECVENNKLYCGKLLFCKYNVWSSGGKFHYHKIKDETFFIIDGHLEVLLKHDKDNYFEHFFMNAGDSLRIKPLVRHKFRTKGKFCKFVEFSSQHRDSDSYYDEEV